MLTAKPLKNAGVYIFSKNHFSSPPPSENHYFPPRIGEDHWICGLKSSKIISEKYTPIEKC